MRTAQLQFFNPWRDSNHLIGEIHSLFGWPVRAERVAVDEASNLPLSIWVNDEGAVLHAPLPGVKADDIDISVLGDTLTLKASRKSEAHTDGTDVLRKERSNEQFSRSVRLPFRVESLGIQASYNHGMLTLKLPRAAEDKRRRIAVQAA